MINNLGDPRKCPCGDRTSPDPSCEICDGHSHDPDTGWGGFTDHFTGKHYYSEEERLEDLKNQDNIPDDPDPDDSWIQ